MKILPFIGIEIILIIGIIMVSGCTSSDHTSSSLTQTTVGRTTLTTTLVQDSTLPPRWGGCTCTIYPSYGNVHCFFHNGSLETVHNFKGPEKSTATISSLGEICMYSGGTTCMCAEGADVIDRQCTENKCTCTAGVCTPTEGSTRTCTRGTCTCTPGTCTYKGGGYCTCTPESCTCSDWNPCTCTKENGTCDPNYCNSGSCYCDTSPCTCTNN